MQTLYRKYRSKDFDEVIGQDPIVKVIRKQVDDGNIGHAYIFSGPRGTGKTSMARLVAKSLNCQKRKNGNPCKKCDSCLKIDSGRSLDLIEIDAASNRGIDEIRRLRERVNFSPSESNYKIYIIDEVHMLTKDAFNALLKTLEEPPKHVIFILATTEVFKIPPTILSRCQRFNFRLASDEDIKKKLELICKSEGFKFSDDALKTILRFAGGSFRDAESVLEKVLGGVGARKDKKVDLEDVLDILGVAEEKEVEKFSKALCSGHASEAMKILDTVIKDGLNLNQFILQTLEYLRHLLIDRITEKKGEFNLSRLVEVITELSVAEQKIKISSIERLPVEISIVKLCSSVVKDIEDSRLSGAEGAKESVVQRIVKLPKKIKIRREESKVKIEEVKEKWNVITEKIRPFNHHLSAFYTKAVPVSVEKNNIILKVPYLFHKTRIESIKGQQIFSKISEELFGLKLTCYCEVCANENECNEIENRKNGEVVLEVLGDLIE